MPSRPPKLTVITNIPSPYRLHEFSVLNEVLKAEDIAFEAIFLSTTERGRHWVFDSSQCTFPHQVASGWSFYLRGKPFLFNPGVIISQLSQPPTWLWLGGSWYLPTVAALAALKRLYPRTWLIGWNESTTLDKHTLSGSSGQKLRKRLLDAYDGWVVPGEEAAKYVRNGLVNHAPPIISFANTVDERIYSTQVAALRAKREALRAKYHLLPDARVALWVARLSPEKGILEFLRAIETVQSNATILIAGEGPQRTEIEAWLNEHPSMHVQLVGHKSADELAELYALSDALLLPSLSEPYGFVAVEALWAGLPLLLSNKVGALPEVLKIGENGWLFDPMDGITARAAFSQFTSASDQQLQAMGEASQQLAQQNFDSRSAAGTFVNQLRNQFPAK